MYLMNEDTICAPATVPGTGAISVVRVSGPEALAAVSGIVECAPGREILSAPGYSARFGRIYMEDGSLLDEVVVSVFRAPHSYTGEDSAEISCHASKFIVDNIMLLLVEAGLRVAAPGEFTRRAYLNGKMDLAQAEAVADLISAESAAAHRVALSQLKGGFSSELKKMRGELLNIVSLMELELDFSEEEVEFADRTELSSLVDSVIAHVGRLVSSFRLGNAIKNGIPVAIVGATNTGKSTLLNALLGEERAIVSDVHGTTRDTIEEVLNVDGLQFRFIDTAGLRETSETVEKIGIERTFKKMNEAQVIFYVVDASRPFGEVAAESGEVLRWVDVAEQKLILVFNKADLLNAAAMDSLVAGLSAMENPEFRVASGDAADAGVGSAAVESAPGFASGAGIESAPGFVPDAGFESAGGLEFAAGVCAGTDGNCTEKPCDMTGAVSGKITEPAMESASAAGLASGAGIESAAESAVDLEPAERAVSAAACADYVAESTFGSASDAAGRAGSDSGCSDAVATHVGGKIFPTVFISAKKGEGIDMLKSVLSDICAEYRSGSDGTLVTNMRHVEALSNARSALDRVRDGLHSGLATDLVSQDIREALYHLGSIVGEISTDEVLGTIFERFCIGK